METLKLITTTKKGTRIYVPLNIVRVGNRIEMLNLPFALKDEVKQTMSNARWHGHTDGRKIWSVADTTRTRFQLDLLQGLNPYDNWDRDPFIYEYTRPLMVHQKDLANRGLTYHYEILASEPGTGKTLAMIEIMERSGTDNWWWVAPTSALRAVELEFEKWGLGFQPKVMTYDGLRSTMREWEDGMPVPQGVMFDESQRLKSARAQRSQAAQILADAIRRTWGWDGYVILASGSPAPKSPVDWWSQCEICYPGFLREADPSTFEWRLAIFQKMTLASQGTFHTRVAWRDNPERCDECGKFKDEHDPISGEHMWIPSKNEVEYLHERLKGMVAVCMKKDCLELPDIRYRQIVLPVDPAVKRVAKALANHATSTIQALTWLRTLSDGFQYEVVDTDVLIDCPVCNGTGEYPAWDSEGNSWLAVCDKCGGEKQIYKSHREAHYYPGPKEQALRELLDENEGVERIIVYAGFTGSVDLCTKVCHEKHWDVVRVDGRGWKVLTHNERPVEDKPLHYWMNHDGLVAFVAHAESGGVGLTLTQACTEVFYSNDFKPENRIQAINRIHRPGMDFNRGATIVDLLHLGTDAKVLDVLSQNHRLEKMTMGQIKEALE